MRLQRLHRYLLLLAALFVLAVLLREDLPGEEMLPDAYRAAVGKPLVEPLAAAAHDGALEMADMKSRLAVAELRVRELTEQLERAHELERYFGKLKWEAPARAIPAWVFSVESDDYRRTFQIDCASSTGIGKGMPVVTGQALLGVVIAVRGNYATVRRVDDPSFRLEVEIEGESEVVRGVARGDGDRGVDVRFVPRASVLKKGQRVFTSRYDKLIPPGLYVGEVSDVADVDEDGLLEVALLPAAALGRLSQVHVLVQPRRGE
ncbi:MAG TPA: rod shape-determining protein MreC [Planctomycetota bacterium]|nr:rod shape-determining protein MreC [Planctomycetota bacterium]